MSALQEYTDLKIICDAVEKAAIKRARRGHRSSAKVAALNSLLSVDQLLHSSQLAVEFMKKKPVDDSSSRKQRQEREDSRPEARPGRGEPGAGSAYASYEGADRWRVCPPDYPGDDWEVEGFTPEASFGFAVNPFDAADADTDQAIRDLLGLDPDEDLAEGFENCFGCDLRVQFDFQLQPINLLLELDNLLDQIQDTIDFWRDYANPLNFLARICDFWDWFGNLALCKQDIIAMLLALQALIAKYANLSVSISLDWTVLFGPLLKFILDALAQLIEQIVQLLTAPIDCVIGFLKTIDEILSGIVDTANVAAAFGESMFGGDVPFGGKTEDGTRDFRGLGEYSAEGTKKNIEWVEGSSEGQRTDGIVPEMDKNPGSWFDGTPGFTSESNMQPPSLEVSSGSMGGTKSETGFDLPTGFNLSGYNGLEEALKDPKFKYSSPLQKLILSLQEAKKWITTLFANILFSLKSLSALVSGGISINLQNIGFLMLVLDIINLIKLLVSLKGTNPCSDNIEEIAEFIKRYYPDSEVVIKEDGIIEVTKGKYTQEISLANSAEDCSVFDFGGVTNTSKETYDQSKKD